MNSKLYQIYFEDGQPLDKGCIPIDSRGVDVSPLYENKYIIETHAKLEGADYYGVTSWRMHEKTGLTKESIDNFINTHPGFNCYLYGQYGNEFSLLDNKAHSTPIGMAWKRLFQCHLFKDSAINGDIWINCFCNFWIADKQTWDRYMVYLNKTLELFETDQTLLWIMNNLTFKHREGKVYKLHPFILEYLFGLFLADNPDIKWTRIPTKLSSASSKKGDNLMEIYKKHAGPIGNGDKGNLHKYIESYDRLFFPYKDKPITLLEIGVAEGKSLKMWREYFPNARIIGIDLKKPRLPVANCELAICDQADKKALDELLGNNQFDIIIDDGSHLIHHQILSHRYLYPRLKKGGLYIIEDIQNPDHDIKLLEEVCGKCEVIDTRKLSKRYDDILMVWTKI